MTARDDGRLRRLLWQFTRFVAVGGVSFSVDYGLFFLLLHFGGVQYLVASTISFTVSLVLNYILTLKFVFEAKQGRNIALEFALYIGLNVVALGLNQFILFVAVDLLAMTPLIGKLVATAIVLVYNFVSRKILIERLATRRPTSIPSTDSSEPGGNRS